MDELQRQGFRSKIFQAHHESKAVTLTVDEAFAVSDSLDAALARAEAAEAALATERVALREFAKGALLRTMHDLSEACWCAGWLHGMEYFLWNVVESGQATEWGMDNVYQRDVDDLRRLRELAGGWWIWDDEKFETFVSLEEMRRLAETQP